MISQAGVNNIAPQDLMPPIKEEKLVAARFHCTMHEKSDGPIFLALKILDTLDLKTNSIESMIKDKTLTFIKYENELIKTVGMHLNLVKLMETQNVTELALCLPNIQNAYKKIEEDCELEPMNDESYQILGKKFSFLTN